MRDIIKYCTFFAVLTFATAAITRPKYLDCMNTHECPVGHCCTVGYGRFSIPKCQLIPDRGENCHPNIEFFTNLTLSYPDGQTVNYTDVYTMHCPCAIGLFCSNTDVCQDPIEELKHNELGHENDIQTLQ